MSFLKNSTAMSLLLLLGLLLAASNASAQNILSCPVNNLVACVGMTGNVAPTTLCCAGIGQLVRIEAQFGEEAAKNCTNKVIAIAGPFDVVALENACHNGN
ncbi:hypothetical protein SLE2022_062690 [Rubroshorea leprosula]